MNMPKRFILQFFFQLLLVSSFIAVLIFIFWVFFGYTLTKLEVNSDLTKADVSSIEGSFSIDKGQITIESDIKKLAKKQDGWIAVLSKDGKLLKTYNTPADFEFTKTDYKLLLSENQSLQQYDYKIWTIREDTKKPLIILFGTENSSKGILETIKKEVNWKKSQLDLSEAVKKNIKNSQGWVQLINVDGSTQDGFMADNQKDHYSVYELLQLTKVENKDSSAYYYEQTGQVLLVGTEKVDYGQIETEMMKAFGSTAFIIFVVSLLLLLAVTIVFGYRFGAPLVTIMNWIGDLGKGVYEDGHYKHSVIMTKKGKLKKKYRIYKELITTLTQLTETLEQNKQARIKASKVRDEWISGLSHDLKTPLASIGGYAEMLQSDQYSWSESEVRTFSATIAEKAQYMKQLLEDLTLTYQLRSDAFPIAKENVEINEQIRRTVIHYVNGPAGQQYQFVFQPYEGSVIAAVDPKWFQRIMENLLENALKYNPPETTVTVSIRKLDQHLLMIMIEDDGVGMDNETLNRLFERYYRGTNTSSSNNGTGLGMAITKKLIELQGGSIKVKSELGKGTYIRILLPLADE
ncbi:HAMP domain-containing sensor histidine kinase [Niallia sp. MER 6]|uniref:HAMP domain-containing sensor histidine kinase n=1 Tax=Niallia sp. MER 6 TaxID=2939567 RepID=UPI00203A4EEA|nr:HAMP domain-containing sensor histidine kinase [Niallia sp. MER 6]MCM3029767.1 HAMP domain-containing histidine kinase [Niallia sp. MER 6]